MAKKTTSRRKTRTETFTVVGIEYRLTKQSRRELNALTPFMVGVKREPENSHDQNAIAVILLDAKIREMRGVKLGYLTRQVASVYAPVMDRGDMEIIAAEVVQVDDEGTAQLKLTIQAA